MPDNTLIALYEIKRQNVLLGFLQHPRNVSASLAYAHQHRLSPIFDEEIVREVYGEDPFEEVYAVKRDFMLGVLNHVADLDDAENFEDLAFSRLEDKFGGYKANRMELFYTIEYMRINGRFDDRVYDAISNMAPVEAKRYAREFGPEQVSLS